MFSGIQIKKNDVPPPPAAQVQSYIPQEHIPVELEIEVEGIQASSSKEIVFEICQAGQVSSKLEPPVEKAQENKGFIHIHIYVGLKEWNVCKKNICLSKLERCMNDE